jgi:hypothetical protein
MFCVYEGRNRFLIFILFYIWLVTFINITHNNDYGIYLSILIGILMGHIFVILLINFTCIMIDFIRKTESVLEHRVEPQVIVEEPVSTSIQIPEPLQS